MGHCGSDHVGVREMGISKCMEREGWGGLREWVCFQTCCLSSWLCEIG